MNCSQTLSGCATHDSPPNCSPTHHPRWITGRRRRPRRVGPTHPVRVTALAHRTAGRRAAPRATSRGTCRRRISPRRRGRQAALAIDHERLIITFVTNPARPGRAGSAGGRPGRRGRARHAHARQRPGRVRRRPVLCGHADVDRPRLRRLPGWTRWSRTCARRWTRSARRHAQVLIDASHPNWLRVWRIVDPETCTRRHLTSLSSVARRGRSRSPRTAAPPRCGGRRRAGLRRGSVMFLRGGLTQRQRQRTPAQRVR